MTNLPKILPLAVNAPISRMQEAAHLKYWLNLVEAYTDKHPEYLDVAEAMLGGG